MRTFSFFITSRVACPTNKTSHTVPLTPAPEWTVADQYPCSMNHVVHILPPIEYTLAKIRRIHNGHLRASVNMC